VASLAVHLQATTTLSSKSMLMAHGVLRALLSRARFEGLIASNPAADLPKGELPKLKPTRNVSAWTRAEVERWITPDPKVPPEHTVAYAIAAFTGARLGEVAGLRWQDLDTEARPLWRWSLRHQYDGAPLKTDNPRDIPVHPELQRILAAWKLEGWPLLMCRHPRPSDPVVPRILRRAHGDAVHGRAPPPQLAGGRCPASPRAWSASMTPIVTSTRSGGHSSRWHAPMALPKTCSNGSPTTPLAR
jgi:integrase